MTESKTAKQLRKELTELVGVEFDVTWPASGASDPRVRVRATHPERPFEVVMEFVQGDPPEDRREETGWVLVGYGLVPRIPPDRDTEPSDLTSVTSQVATHYGEALPLYRDMAAF